MALTYKTGTYIGNGTSAGVLNHITGVGFTPKVVIIWSQNTGIGENRMYLTSTALMSGADRFIILGDNGVAVNQTDYDRFTALGTDGFTVRTGSMYNSKNKNGSTYFYICLGGDDINSGTYTGNGADNRNITGVGFQPVFALTAGGNDHHTFKLNSTGASTDAAQYFYNAANTSNTIQALQSDGFQVGTSLSNTNGTVYYWFAIKGGSNVVNFSYTGNGTDDRNISLGTNVNPHFLFIKGNGATNAVFRMNTMTGDVAKFRDSNGFVANIIQAMSQGQIQIGSDAHVNTNGVEYQMFVIGDPTASNSNFLMFM